jgi:hypothetical protein
MVWVKKKIFCDKIISQVFFLSQKKGMVWFGEKILGKKISAIFLY